MRQCTKCQQLKELAAFYIKAGRINEYMSQCKRCFNHSALKRQQAKKKRAVDLMGGKCSACSYNKCMNALEFHHLNPSQKSKNWSTMRGWTWERIEKELKKCILLCSNCHRELEAV